MKASGSGPSREVPPLADGHVAAVARLPLWSVAILASAYAIAHLPVLPPSLEDIDSINFALGLRHFDVALHQPHPPGYPVYIALGRTAKATLEAVAPSLGSPRTESLSLAIWSPIAGAVALVAAY